MVAAAPVERTDPVDLRELTDLVTRARSGDELDLNALRSFLDEHPEVCQRVGDLGSRVEVLWMRIVSDDHPLERESLCRQVLQMKTELEGESPPSQVVRLLIQQVITSWLTLKHSETEEGRLTGTETISVRRFFVQRSKSAQQRYLEAINALMRAQQMLRATKSGTSKTGKRRKAAEGTDTTRASEV